MYKVRIVGMGSLGSTLAEEIAKRSFAMDMPIAIDIFDFDKIESRNVAAQPFTPADIGKYKCNFVFEQLKKYEMVEVLSYNHKVTSENIIELMPPSPYTVIVDAVDNLPTRQLLWQHGKTFDMPVMHIAMSKKGFGAVEWNAGEYDTFHLSPRNLGAQPKEEDDPRLPPCELNSLRGLILNTVQAGLNALYLYLGTDTIEAYKEILKDAANTKGLLSNWRSDIYGYKLIPEITEIIGGGENV